MPPPRTPRNRSPKRPSISSSGSDLQRQRVIQRTETAAGAGSTTSTEQAGQGKAVLPSSAVRETTIRSYDPYPLLRAAPAAAPAAAAAAAPAAAAAAAAAAGPASHVGETTLRTYDSGSDAAEPGPRVGDTTVRAYGAGSDAARARHVQAAAPPGRSIAALSWEFREMELNEDPAQWRGVQREPHRRLGAGERQSSRLGPRARETLSPPTETTRPQEGTAAKPPRSPKRLSSAEAVAARGGTRPSLPPVDGSGRDERVYTKEARAMVLKLLSEGKTVLDVARITGVVVKTIQKWQKEMQV